MLDQWYSTWGTRNHLALVKTKHRNLLNLEPALILALTKIRPRIEGLACQKQAQRVGTRLTFDHIILRCQIPLSFIDVNITTAVITSKRLGVDMCPSSFELSHELTDCDGTWLERFASGL
jgi:hypothetical protein